MRSQPRAGDRPEHPEEDQERPHKERLRADELAERLTAGDLRLAEVPRHLGRSWSRSGDRAHSVPPKRMRGLSSEYMMSAKSVAVRYTIPTIRTPLCKNGKSLYVAAV